MDVLDLDPLAAEPILTNGLRAAQLAPRYLIGRHGPRPASCPVVDMEARLIRPDSPMGKCIDATSARHPQPLWGWRAACSARPVAARLDRKGWSCTALDPSRGRAPAEPPSNHQ